MFRSSLAPTKVPTMRSNGSWTFSIAAWMVVCTWGGVLIARSPKTGQRFFQFGASTFAIDRGPMGVDPGLLAMVRGAKSEERSRGRSDLSLRTSWLGFGDLEPRSSGL